MAKRYFAAIWSDFAEQKRPQPPTILSRIIFCAFFEARASICCSGNKLAIRSRFFRAKSSPTRIYTNRNGKWRGVYVRRKKCHFKGENGELWVPNPHQKSVILKVSCDMFLLGTGSGDPIVRGCDPCTEHPILALI